MSEIAIVLDPSHPAYRELSKAVPEALDEFESISYRQEKKELPPGTLVVGLHEVAQYVIQHHDKILDNLPSILSALSNLLRWSSAKIEARNKENNPITVVVENKSIKLPASESAQKRFVQRLANPTAKNAQKKRVVRGKAKATEKGSVGRKANSRKRK